MKAVRLALGSLLFVLLLASASMAQLQRTFVSGLGSDGNPCSRTAPCRTFAQAILGTNAGGEVVALDSAGYGPFSITKPIIVEAPEGVYAGITVTSGNGITITAGGSDVVVVRGLTVNLVGGTGTIGIKFNQGGALHVEHCAISGLADAGIDFMGPGSLSVKDTLIRNTGAAIGVVGSLSGSTSATIDSVRLEGNAHGLVVAFEVKASIRNSVASGNSGDGLTANGGGGPAELNVENCLVANNGVGVEADGTPGAMGIVRLSNSIVTDNGFGLRTGGGTILSRRDNTVEGNGTDTMGTIGSYTAK